MADYPQYDISPEELELLEAYLRNELSPNERLQLETSPLFAQKLEEVRYLATGVEEAMLQRQLNTFHAALQPAKTIPLYRRWWAAAAVLLAAVVASWLLWPKGNENERLYSAYFTPDMGLPVTMGSTDSLSYLFYDGMISYKEEKYAAAFARWETLANTRGYNDTLRYYMGMAQLNQQHIQQAERLLLPLTNDQRAAFSDDVKWYLALIRLRNGDRTSAIGLLKQLPNREEAKRLLAEIED